MMPSRRVSLLRDRLRETDHHIHAPCVCQDLCPETATKGGYCFHAIKVPGDAYLQRLGDLSNLRRHEVNFCYLTVGRGPGDLVLSSRELVAGGAGAARLISHPQKRSGGFVFFACHQGGLVRLWLPRHLGDEETLIRAKRLETGTLVFLEQQSHPGQD
jgi:ribosomal protein RSM22 (predicted rRNA methylase)